jgi:transposase-like protein
MSEELAEHDATKLRKLEEELTEEQVKAADHILTNGENYTEVAKHVGKTRQTISNWANNDETFKEYLDVKRNEMFGESLNQIQSVVSQCSNLLAQHVQSLQADPSQAEAFDAAVDILDKVGLFEQAESNLTGQRSMGENNTFNFTQIFGGSSPSEGQLREVQNFLRKFMNLDTGGQKEVKALMEAYNEEQDITDAAKEVTPADVRNGDGSKGDGPE